LHYLSNCYKFYIYYGLVVANVLEGLGYIVTTILARVAKNIYSRNNFIKFNICGSIA